MNEQIRGVILSAIAAVAGWSGITTVGLLIQVASLQSDTRSLIKGLEKNDANDQRTEDQILKELTLIRESMEGHVRK